MKAQQLRDKFTAFFQQRGHQRVDSSSLVPAGDDTLLFANAGMNQFKDYFTGVAKPPWPRAVSIQKCVRAGGKHNDLENVGYTARHHTYFEMLGNFSFGDYFKAEAIEYAWEFLTKELGLPESKLLVTVHREDDEAERLWTEKTNIDPARVFRRGDADNFWEMGELGPCGPCSEIFYDHGERHTSAGFAPTEDLPFDDGGRFVEIWNLVFMQYEKTPKGRHPLPNPSIDTGMGLERLTAAVNGVYLNYDTDLFLPLIKKVESVSKSSHKDGLASMRVVADHARSCCMLLTDGVIPAPEGRGYVLRRIIRRAVRHLRKLDAPSGSFSQMVGPVFELLGDAWPQNVAGKSLAQKFLRAEEDKFLETLDQGLKFLRRALNKEMSGKILDGALAFKLYDTYGFPLDLTETILREQGLSVDKAGFEKAMDERVEDSRKSWKGTSREGDSTLHQELEKHGKSIFTGHQLLEDRGKLLAIIDNGLIFDRTPFYAEGGGQVGDAGEVLLEGQAVAHIEDTRAPVAELHVHYCSGSCENLKIGQEYELKVSPERRNRTAKNHSATHLLQAALIRTLGDHVTQAGSLVNEEKLRFDFTHTQALAPQEIQRVEELVNEAVARALPVRAEITDMKEARKRGAMALFGEKYGEQVRVLAMGDFSTELCGGTHVANTSEIGLFSIVSESALGSGVRRIEALTSTAALKRLRFRSDILHQAEQMTATKETGVPEKITALQEEIKRQNKTLREMNDKLGTLAAGDLFSDVETLGDGVAFKLSKAPDGADLKKLSDGFVAKHPRSLLVLYGIKGPRASVLVRAGKKLDGVDCRELLQKILSALGGRGGGRADMAQGSGSADKIEALEAHVRKLISSGIP